MKLIDKAHCRTETPPKSETKALLDQIKELREKMADRMGLLAERLYLR